MNLRHAAALALIGWYLMMPDLDASNNVLTNLPLSKWSVKEGYDSGVECNDGKLGYYNLVKDLPQSDAKKRRVLAMQCIATDDPRLKEK